MSKYSFKDHGQWVPYSPEVLPEWAEQLAENGQIPAFLKRVSDGVDWYTYRNTEGQFAKGSVLFCTLYYQNNDEEVIKSVFSDPTMIFPANQRLVEVFGVDPKETKPHNLFAEMVYEPKKQVLSGEPGLKLPQKTIKKDLWNRATDDEVDAIEHWLSIQTNRQQRLFNDLAAIDHGEQIYADLLKAFTNLFGKERAEALLALSK